jgi:adenosylmethionine-8-amino-7-oxononanoate aminotransferase
MPPYILDADTQALLAKRTLETFEATLGEDR